MENTVLPLNLQHFAEGAQAPDPSPAPAEPTPAQPPQPAPQAAAQPSITPENLAAALLKASETRTQRAENNLLRDMAQQHGMSEDELRTMLENAKAEKAKQLSPEAQSQLDGLRATIEAKAVTAEIKLTGAEMGLLDADAAMKLADMTGVKVGEDGSVEGVKEALEALQKSKPYLFGTAQQAKPPLTTQMSHQAAHHEDEFQKRIDKYQKK